jgi:hypothetical protein
VTSEVYSATKCPREFSARFAKTINDSCVTAGSTTLIISVLFVNLSLLMRYVEYIVAFHCCSSFVVCFVRVDRWFEDGLVGNLNEYFVAESDYRGQLQ